MVGMDAREDQKESKVVDCRGQVCPMPIGNLAMACRNVANGGMVVFIASDLGACSDVKAWARMTGNKIVSIEEGKGNEITVTIQVIK